MEQEYLALLFSAMCMMFSGGVIVGVFWRGLRRQAHEGTDRFNPRPGTQPFRPKSRLKPFHRSPDMLTDNESKNP